MVQAVAFTASTNESRPILTGVLLVIENGMLSLAATERFRIAVRSAPIAVSPGQAAPDHSCQRFEKCGTHPDFCNPGTDRPPCLCR
jgi:hypothetical protein